MTLCPSTSRSPRIYWRLASRERPPRVAAGPLAGPRGGRRSGPVDGEVVGVTTAASSLVLGYTNRMRTRLDRISTEEATKNALVMPFINHVLGYNVFDPAEVVLLATTWRTV